MSQMRKVLIITYYWPPASGPGVQRILKFTKYLPEFGWQPIVLTPAKGEFPATDVSLIDDIPETCRVVKTPSFEPNLFYKKFVGLKPDENIPLAVLAEKKLSPKKRLAHWIRLNFFIPDAKIGWYPFAVHAGKKIIKQMQPHLILSSSPPPTVQIIAKALAQWSGLKWIADFRDPWTDIFYYQNHAKMAFAERLDKHLENRVLKQADRVLAVSPSNVRQLNKKNQDDKFHVLYNGYDAEDLCIAPTSDKNSAFTLVFVGNLKATHNCDALWQVLSECVQQNSDFKQHFQLRFLGLTHPFVQQRLERYHLMEFTEMAGFQPHAVAVQAMKDAAALLFIIPNAPNNNGILTGKIFEYLASGTPLLSIGPPNGDAAKLLNDCGAGQMISPQNAAHMQERILGLFEKWQTDSLGDEQPEMTAVQQFERKTLVKQLANIMNTLMENKNA